MGYRPNKDIKRVLIPLRIVVPLKFFFNENKEYVKSLYRKHDPCIKR